MNVETSTVNGTRLNEKLRPRSPHLLRLIGSGCGGGASRTSLPVAAGLVLSRDDGQRGAAGAAPGGRSGRRGDQRQASSLRPPGEEERVVRSRQFPASWGPLGVRVSSRLADWENETDAQRTTSPPARIRAPAEGAVLGEAGAGVATSACELPSRGQLLSSPDAAGRCELSFSCCLRLKGRKCVFTGLE
ncbi:TPA: hypothetical protein BOS_12471 [Bos taurus]|nr:TPA: hypothetical protein BOS_12471 [Bos taurus]